MQISWKKAWNNGYLSPQYSFDPLLAVQVVRAHMYLYFYSAHKPDFYTDDQVPDVRHLVDVYPVLKPWDEAQATTTKRLDDEYWEEEYLALDGTDAADRKVGRVAMNPGQPRDRFVELQVRSKKPVIDESEIEPYPPLLMLARPNKVRRATQRTSSEYRAVRPQNRPSKL